MKSEFRPRMCKKKQMAWSRRGAQYLLHVNTAVINGKLYRYTGHGPRQCSMAARPQLLSGLIQIVDYLGAWSTI
jgi:hypothetical protein